MHTIDDYDLERRMYGHSLLEAMLSGRTDFADLELVGEGFDFKSCGKFPLLQVFLKSRDPSILSHRLHFERARMTRIKAIGMQMPFLMAKGAFLERCDFSESCLDNADFRQAGLKKTRFVMSSIRNAYFRGALMIQSDLSKADLEGSVFDDANLERAVLHEAKLHNARLRDVKLAYANLTGADLSGTDLRQANLFCANLSGANLSGAVFTGANQQHMIARNATTDASTKDFSPGLERPED